MPTVHGKLGVDGGLAPSASTIPENKGNNCADSWFIVEVFDRAIVIALFYDAL